MTQVVLEPYAFDKPCQIVVDVEKAERCNVKFTQTPAFAILSNRDVPPECINRVIDSNGIVMFQAYYSIQFATGQDQYQLGTRINSSGHKKFSESRANSILGVLL